MTEYRDDERVAGAIRVQLYRRTRHLRQLPDPGYRQGRAVPEAGRLPLRPGVCGDKQMLIGVVVHRGERGVGIRLADRDRDFFRDIVELFKGLARERRQALPRFDNAAAVA